VNVGSHGRVECRVRMNTDRKCACNVTSER
jgi:hypothetical protein